jgi:type II secretory pathway pseudopilin PulG
MDRLKRWLWRKATHCRQDEHGLGLVETLVAVALLGGVAVTFIAALSTGSLAVSEHNQEMVAQRLAQAQQEAIKAATYDINGTGYPAVTAPSGYSIAVTVNSGIYADNNIQKITVTVSRGGTIILTTEAYKVNR